MRPAAVVALLQVIDSDVARPVADLTLRVTGEISRDWPGTRTMLEDCAI